jgi:putative copper export protein
VSNAAVLDVYAILVFFVTGIHLMLIDPNYLGIGNFSNPWAMLMLVKHILILVMIGMGFWFNAIQRVGPAMRSNTRAAEAVGQFRRYSNAMAVCGVVVLLLTALSQAQ